MSGGLNPRQNRSAWGYGPAPGLESPMPLGVRKGFWTSPRLESVEVVEEAEPRWAALPVLGFPSLRLPLWEVPARRPVLLPWVPVQRVPGHASLPGHGCSKAQPPESGCEDAPA